MKSAKLLADDSAKRAWHVQNQPHTAFQHGYITHWSHMEEMKWTSMGLLGTCVLVANNLGFARLCLISANLLASDSVKRAWCVQHQPQTAFIT
jgi:hypothetical protein